MNAEPAMPRRRAAWTGPFRRLDAWLFLACVTLFLTLPGLDLLIAALTWEDGRFVHADAAPVRLIYQLLAYSQYVIGSGLLIGLLVARLAPRLRAWQRTLAYLVCVLICGPGLLVNVVLKDHSFDRPRPVQIETFGGTAKFAPFGQFSGACERNCAFVSGHAAVAFFPIALAWTTRRRAWLAVGIATGALAGALRILQGGHFLSDVVFAFWAVYGVCLLLAPWFGLGRAEVATRSAVAP